jgi:hypothetical protein
MAMTASAKDFHFDSTISREVLENYLSRSITFVDLLSDDLSQSRNKFGIDPHDNLRLILETKAKFVGRSIKMWTHESELPAVLKTAKPFAEALHEADPDIILEAGEFEIVTPEVSSITIPESVLQEFGQPVTDRKFSYQEMIYTNGKYANRWGRGKSVPDMSRVETRMWFYYLATCYIDIGAEAIHFGQIDLMDKNDPNHLNWLDMLGHVRAYAHQHARRHLVLCNAHEYKGSYVVNGNLLFDFNAKPLRIVEVNGQPYQGILKVGYADSIYTKSEGGMTPSGWACDHLPYLVEFDNFGSYVHNPGKPSTAPFIWGWDEITWFALLPESDRNAWLRYAWDWLKNTDPNGHLEMPGSRVLATGNPDGPHWYSANIPSAACPTGFNTEGTIKEIWAGDDLQTVTAAK